MVTPTEREQALRGGDFATLWEALSYAAGAATGANFFDGRGRCTAALSWGAIAEAAEALAGAFSALALPRGSRVAIVAETHPNFHIAFFAARRAALVPVPLPASIHMGGAEPFVALLARLMAHADAKVALATDAFLPYLEQARDATPSELRVGTVEAFLAGPHAALPEPPGPDEVAYVQYTSGSTQFPRGAVLTERSTLRNVLGIIRDGLKIGEQDRFCSWLPFYHDMGLVGKVMVPMASQTSIDYLGPREFAMRPRLWPRLISDHGGTISFSPPFGYELTARRLRAQDAESFSLSHWRIAGCGADMIRPQVLEAFAEALAPAGFRKEALMPSYGMAEVSLAVSFTAPGTGLHTDRIDRATRERKGYAQPGEGPESLRFTSCGQLLPGYEAEIRDSKGAPCPDRTIGTIFLKTPSTMEGYLTKDGLDQSALHGAWLDTGDLGYLYDGTLVVTGRRKDLLIVNGRNLWPQDLELTAERAAEGRTGDAAAFTVEGPERDELVVLLQCRERVPEKRLELLRGVRRAVQTTFGVEANVQGVEPHALPRTTSGKLSRAKAKALFLDKDPSLGLAAAQLAPEA